MAAGYGAGRRAARLRDSDSGAGTGASAITPVPDGRVVIANIHIRKRGADVHDCRHLLRVQRRGDHPHDWCHVGCGNLNRGRGALKGYVVRAAATVDRKGCGRRSADVEVDRLSRACCQLRTRGC